MRGFQLGDFKARGSTTSRTRKQKQDPFAYSVLQPRRTEGMTRTAYNNATNDTEEQFPIPDFVAYNVIMLVFFVMPVSVVNTLTIVALLLDKTTPVPIRSVIVNLLAASLIIILGLYLEHLTSLVLISSNQSLPPIEFCSFIFWLLAGGGASRMVFTATFSVIVFVIVKGGAKAVSKIGLAISLTSLWIVAFLLSSPTLFLYSFGVKFLGGAGCFPQAVEGVTNTTVNIIFLSLWLTIFGIIPSVITITMPLVTTCYLQKHNITGNVQFKKATVKFALFLILDILCNFLGRFVPIIIAFNNKNVQDLSPFYLTLFFANIFLIPTSILIHIYLGGVRKKVKEILLCYPIRFRGINTHERSTAVCTVHVRENSPSQASTNNTLSEDHKTKA